jgi:hypothetical protein
VRFGFFYYLLLKRKKRKKESTPTSGKDEREWRASLIFRQGKPDWKRGLHASLAAFFSFSFQRTGYFLLYEWGNKHPQAPQKRNCSVSGSCFFEERSGGVAAIEQPPQDESAAEFTQWSVMMRA